MTWSPADRDRSDDPFAELGDPVLAVADKRRGLVAVAGAHEYDEANTVGVFHVTDRARRRLLLHSQHPVNAMAFHPTLPLLAMGSGEYDGGYHFEGELLLLHLETGTALSLIEHHLGRQVLGLEWLNDQDLRVLIPTRRLEGRTGPRGRTHRRCAPRRLDCSRSQVAHRSRPGRPSRAGAPPRPARGCPTDGRPSDGDADAPAPHQPSTRIRTG
ncbi:hypothetical protein AB0O68_32600 [Streptomyces sp. NPDC087512]|uniref:hypothetical protein n=1 Tax=Streptomyces sp. NPDC087512 TaxID=3155059 RepID=UPI00342DAE1B